MVLEFLPFTLWTKKMPLLNVFIYLFFKCTMTFLDFSTCMHQDIYSVQYMAHDVCIHTLAHGTTMPRRSQREWRKGVLLQHLSSCSAEPWWQLTSMKWTKRVDLSPKPQMLKFTSISFVSSVKKISSSTIKLLLWDTAEHWFSSLTNCSMKPRKESRRK